MVFGLENMKIYDKLKIIREPVLKGQYLESIYIMPGESTYVDKTHKNEIVDLWHTRLGHVSYHRRKVKMKKSMLKDLPQLEVPDDVICAGC